MSTMTRLEKLEKACGQAADHQPVTGIVRVIVKPVHKADGAIGQEVVEEVRRFLSPAA